MPCHLSFEFDMKGLSFDTSILLSLLLPFFLSLCNQTQCNYLCESLNTDLGEIIKSLRTVLIKPHLQYCFLDTETYITAPKLDHTSEFCTWGDVSVQMSHHWQL